MNENSSDSEFYGVGNGPDTLGGWLDGVFGGDGGDGGGGCGGC